MTSQELRAIRKLLGLNRVAMAQALHTPYKTYEKWETGVSRIPGVVEVAITAVNKYGADEIPLPKSLKGVKPAPEFSE